ncbi:MAG TPA: DNA mismatch repair protein MutS [Candidatus Babeliales bacterium]|nr:DNA mismatch repair protein MutS [Candidatus Babeliales bacterium]
MNDIEKSSLTPLMQQFYEIKREHADTILLFQVGDFYELFFEDAQRASAFLGITLTQRGAINGVPIPLCGVPIHAIDHYLAKLVRGGFKVALCDQLENPQAGKIVARGVTRVLTPGTLTDAQLLDERSASYIFAFVPLQDAWGLLFGELLTAQLMATVLPINAEKKLESELTRFFPDEILLSNTKTVKPFESYFKRLGYFTTKVDEVSQYDDTYAAWLQRFSGQTQTIVRQHPSVNESMQMFYRYMCKTNMHAAHQVMNFSWYEPEDFLLLDGATQRNLELVKNNQDGSRAHTLFSVLDGAVTPMGSRTIKKWIMRPLISKHTILQRQEVVAQYMNSIVLMQQLKELLQQVGDIERLVGRIALYRATHTDYCTLARLLVVIPAIAQLLAAYASVSLLKTIAHALADFSSLHDLLYRAINTDTTTEWIIKQGFDTQLDQIRNLVEHGQHKIIALERAEQQKTGINSLKIRYTQAHGYYIEVTKTHLDAVPAEYIRRQTLVGRERFVTDELQKLQYDIERAQIEIESRERDLFEAVKREVAQHIASLRKAAHALAHVDALLGFARVAYDNNYVRPTYVDNQDLYIVAGRHPVVEQTIASHFIANDIALTDAQSLLIITGPNMGGKSTYLRQVALIAIMAHCGSFVPAQSAHIPILDRVFTRIGAGDNVAEGKSTFLVEMEETATICMQATKNSLIILDEVGRGTSTFDGLAIAQAVVEYIYTQIQARCLFATHYHELTALADNYPGIVSYHAASKKTATGIILLHKIIKGVADGSFGIEVARLADLPQSIIDRAEILVTEFSHVQLPSMIPARIDRAEKDADTIKEAQDLQSQLLLMQNRLNHQEQLLTLLQAIDYDNVSPKQALDILWQLKSLNS